MKEIEFGIRLLKTKVEEINFKEPDEEFISSFDENNLKIKLSIKFTVNIEIGLITSHLKIDYEYETVVNVVERTLLNYNASFDFKIENLNNIIIKNGDKIDIPTKVLAVIAGVGIGTSRGIIIGKTAGAFINRFYIPILDPMEIVEKSRQEI